MPETPTRDLRKEIAEYFVRQAAEATERGSYGSGLFFGNVVFEVKAGVDSNAAIGYLEGQQSVLFHQTKGLLISPRVDARYKQIDEWLAYLYAESEKRARRPPA
jgi:hypothetical protein